MKFYTYIHTRADDKKVFYVGKGTARDKRAHSVKGRSIFWKRTVEKHGLIVDVVMWFSQEEDAFAHEKFLIQCFKDMRMPLANLTEGGEGASGLRHSAQTRARLSDIQKGRKRRPEQIAATVAGLKGQKRSPEQRARITEAQTGRECKPETRAKLRQLNTGKVASASSRAKASAALKGRKKSPEHTAKVVATRIANGGYRKGPEAALKAWVTKRAKKAAANA